MGRRQLVRQLDVWMNGSLVGFWKVAASGQHEFSYAAGWLEHPAMRPISLSLPLQPVNQVHRGPQVQHFFENLLPDTPDIRRRIQRRFATHGIAAFDLLAEIGRDCVGALQLLPQATVPDTIQMIEAEEIDESAVAQLLRETAGGPMPGRFSEDTFRISIAGAQEKTALLRRKDRWYIPRGTTPTTHILKLPLGNVGNMRADLSTSVENEWLCSRILLAYGQDTARSEIQRFEDQTALVVERFDRRLSDDGSWIIRIPQEDMCQVNGLSPDQKYESEGGPGIAAIMQLLLGSENAERDRRDFFRAQILFWMLCAIDGHAKNFSVFIGPEGSFSLTPLYDVLSAYPVLGHGLQKLSRQEARMAMAVSGKNRHYRWDRIARRHWISTARLCGFDSQIESVLDELVSHTPDVIDTVREVLPHGFPNTVSEPIFEGLREAAQRLAQ